MPGVGDLAKGGYKLATSADARSQAVDTISKGATAAGQLAKTAVNDPATAASQVGHASSGAWNSVSTAYQQAAANSHGAEFIGKAVGQGAVLAATLPVPGGAEAKGAAGFSAAGRLAEAAGDLGKAGNGAADTGEALHVADAASSTATAHAATDATSIAGHGADAQEAIDTRSELRSAAKSKPAEPPDVSKQAPDIANKVAEGTSPQGAKDAALSPEIAANELTGKTRSEIRHLAVDKGLTPKGDPAHPDHPRRWSDPVTNKPRIRLDRGHVDAVG